MSPVARDGRPAGATAARVFARIAAWVAGHAVPVLVVGGLVAVASALAALSLPTQSVTDALTEEDSPSLQATDRAERIYGQDPIVVLAKGDLQQMLLSSDLGQLLRLEGCIAGNTPPKAKPLPGPCPELARLHPAQLVSGPATFLNQAVIGVTKVYRREQRRVNRIPAGPERVQARQRLLRIATTIATRYGLTGLPSLGDANFISRVVFDPDGPAGTPKAKLSYLFPNSHSAQIIVRLRSDLTDEQRSRAIELIKRAAGETVPRHRCGDGKVPRPCFALAHGSYVVSGAPVVIDGLSGALRSALLLLFAVALVLMALTLWLAFGSRRRLLPLALALASAAITFGLVRAVGGAVSLAAIAGLPIMIGLAVDYAVQLQARHDEQDPGLDRRDAAGRAAAASAPVVATACLATAAGFAVLMLSPSPMVREFGLLLVAGVAVAFAVALVLGHAAFGLGRARRGGARRAVVDRGPASRLVRHGVKSTIGLAIVAPGRLLLIGAIVSACGWAVGTQARTVTDIAQLVPTRVGVVADLLDLQRTAGVSGELDVVVRSRRITDPRVVAWIADFRKRALADAGYGGRDPSCADADLCPGPAITDFLTDSGAGMSGREIRSVLASLPAYDLGGVIEMHRSRGSGGGVAFGPTAKVAFAIRSGPLDRQQQTIDGVRAAIAASDDGRGPPPGVTATLTGLPVVAAESADRLSGARYWLILGGIAAVGLMLLILRRSWRGALLPLVPIVIAGGWSALLLSALGVSLNPMSAVLGVLVTAISTEFSVILAARYEQERAAGLSLPDALRRAYGRTGAAVFASGVTALAGFATLAASDIRMLRDFGLVSVVDLGVALIGVALVLPAALAWAERERVSRRVRPPVPGPAPAGSTGRPSDGR